VEFREYSVYIRYELSLHFWGREGIGHAQTLENKAFLRASTLGLGGFTPNMG
jgi:hypothetical protein